MEKNSVGEIKSPVEMGKYTKAFIKRFQSNREEFLIKPVWKNGPMMVNYNNKLYQINSYNDLKQYAYELLTTELAIHLPLEVWIQIAPKDIHLNPDFMKKLSEKLDRDEDKKRLDMANNLSNYADKSKIVFWNSINNLGDTGLYKKAIIAASQTSDLNVLIDRLVQGLIANGDQFLNQVEGGFFDIVYLNDNKDTEGDDFYIFTIDPTIWDIAK